MNKNRIPTAAALAASAVLLSAGAALAGVPVLKPLPHPAGQPGGVLNSQVAVAAVATSSTASPAPSTWTPLTNQPTFLADGASNPILLTDGSVLIQDTGFPDWWKLTPDQSGSYVNGTWTQVASLQSGYSPLYHSSAVLTDGRLIIEGGEYNCDPTTGNCDAVWQTQGSIYDPVANTWTPVAPPAGWTTIGDAQSIVLPDGTYMQANCCTKQSALLDPKTLTWTPNGTGKFDPNDEEGWVLIPGGQVLVVDAYVPLGGFQYQPDGTNSELYDPRTDSWSSAGSTIVQLWDSAAACGGESAASFELGPGALRPDGTVFYAGANGCGPANTAIYDTHSRHWSAGPVFPGNLGIADGPAAVEPNGKVLMMASPLVFNSPATFFEWDGNNLTEVAGPPNAVNDVSYFGNMIVLPTGQILLTDFSNDVEIFTPSTGVAPGSAPVVTHAPAAVVQGGTYQISGVRLNGMTQGAYYGDDVQAATNFPLVRITNIQTGHVSYSRTHDHSSMAVASDKPASTSFDVPAGQELGYSKLEVVANGVASSPVFVLVTTK